jgi:hypothetical protein
MCLFLGHVSGVNSTGVPCNVNFPGFWPRILMMPGAILNQEGDGKEAEPSLRLVIQQAVRSFLSETLGLGVKTIGQHFPSRRSQANSKYYSNETFGSQLVPPVQISNLILRTVAAYVMPFR